MALFMTFYTPSWVGLANIKIMFSSAMGTFYVEAFFDQHYPQRHENPVQRDDHMIRDAARAL